LSGAGADRLGVNRSANVRPAQPHRLLFPAAAIFAATAVPFWALRYTGLVTRVPGNWPAHWHGHEMVFGYALAVVGGYLLTRLSSLGLALTSGAWLLGRLVYLGPELPAWATATAALAYPICLFAIAGTAFLRTAKRGRNAAFGLLLAGFVLAELLVQLTPLGVVQDGASRGLTLGVDLIAMLLFAMGGRIIAAASSGALQRQGQHLPGLAQPGLERLGMLALLAMAILDVLALLPGLVAALAIIAAGTIVARLGGSRLAGREGGRCRHPAPRLCLAGARFDLEGGGADPGRARALGCPARHHYRRSWHALDRHDDAGELAEEPATGGHAASRSERGGADLDRRGAPARGRLARDPAGDDRRGGRLLDARLPGCGPVSAALAALSPPPQPRPTNGILVAITVRNRTLASAGWLAMKTTARATFSTSIRGSTLIDPSACITPSFMRAAISV
jgi:hypothetical protein